MTKWFRSVFFVGLFCWMGSVSYAAPSLKDNFYQSVNAAWLQQAKIPDSEPAINSFREIKTKYVDPTLRNIMEHPEPENTTDHTLHRLYVSYQNHERRNQLGVQPIQSYLHAIDAVKQYDDVALLMSDMYQDDIVAPFGLGASADFHDSSVYVLHVVQSGLGLPRKYYISKSKRGTLQRQWYAAYAAHLFSLAGYPHADQRAAHLLDIEQSLATDQNSPVENRDTHKLDHTYTFKALEQALSNFPLREMFAHLRIDTHQKVLVHQPAYVQALNRVFREYSVAEWQDYMRAQVLFRFAGVLSDDFEQASVAYQKQLGVIQEEPAPWKKGLEFVSGSLPKMTGRAYVEHAFDEASKQYVQRIVDDIKAEFRAEIASTTLFGEATKRKALYKLDHMVYNIAYPDQWKDFSKLDIRQDDLLGNVIRISRFQYKDGITRLGKTVDRSEWGRSPHEINAFYSPTRNKFVLLAGILNPPIFDKNATDAQNYGGIGTVIAHEVGHGFDDTGSQFDAEGNLENWWQEKDKAAFSKIKNRLIAKANQYEVYPGIYMNGALTVGETIGDLNGVNIAFRAYKKKAKGHVSSQAFFLQYARVWRGKDRRAYALKLLEMDHHPLSEFRTNFIVQNVDAFYDAFDITPKDKMYVKPSDRVHMW